MDASTVFESAGLPTDNRAIIGRTFVFKASSNPERGFVACQITGTIASVSVVFTGSGQLRLTPLVQDELGPLNEGGGDIYHFEFLSYEEHLGGWIAICSGDIDTVYLEGVFELL